MATIRSFNPATGKFIKSYHLDSRSEINRKLGVAIQAYAGWSRQTFAKRAVCLARTAKILRNNQQEFARLMTLEMGKPIMQSLAEIEKCAWVCEYFAQNAQILLQEELIKTEAQKSYLRFDPLGIILAVMPWNFPFWQVFRAAAPALMAGNVMILKHASNVPGCALAIEKIFHEAGFPPGLFTTLLIDSQTVAKLLTDDRIVAATVTGSEAAGSRVAEICGKNLKKTVLELGGSDPFIVLSDANLSQVSLTACRARTLNSGQSCIAAKRFIVAKKVAEDFTRLFVQNMKNLVVGDPFDEKTQVGAQAREDLLEALDNQVKKSISLGARLLTGGKRMNRTGYFYEPTVLGNVKKGMPAYDEELFGPVAAIIEAKDEDEIVRIANDTRFGLGASIWTKDIKKGEQLAAQIEAGAVFINSIVKSDPRLPFGGIKKSGYGRELGEYGIKEFVNVKTMVVEG